MNGSDEKLLFTVYLPKKKNKKKKILFLFFIILNEWMDGVRKLIA